MTRKRILVLGAYGLIGQEIATAVQDAGHEVIGLVRSSSLAERLLPSLDCRTADISKLLTPEDWRRFVLGVDAVVNASGALQTGMRDNLGAVQDAAIKALIKACEDNGVQDYVQISAPGAVETAETEFLRSKARADAVLRQSTLNWVIFKPGLVIARNAYGGTALIRALAGFPFVLPIVLPDARIQTVSVNDVAQAVRAAIDERVEMRTEYDLVEDAPHSLLDITRAFREQMGFSVPFVLRLPYWFGAVAARLGDAAGWFGWRPPLRTTALKVLRDDVRGDPAPWRAASGDGVAKIEETLTGMPATIQERVFARAQLLTPVVICLLSAFFIASGAIGFAQNAEASAILADRVGDSAARLLVFAGAALDILLGAAILFRAWARPAAALMIGLSIVYLAAGTVFTPHLWLDPLGPFVKVFPVMGLALCALLMIEER
ncbi:SDR family oxidoreductase [Hyphococcus luteus]|uniref:SDR family oxidoreductase n=1 Tax=Hyphococcus luteus TaxID=2058213 RepID=UPI0010574DD2|nr:SDR family oxidoreductase [Marinicaulis flavus]